MSSLTSTDPMGSPLAFATAGEGPQQVSVVGLTTHLEWFLRHPTTLLVEPLTQDLQLTTFDKAGGIADGAASNPNQALSAGRAGYVQ